MTEHELDGEVSVVRRLSAELLGSALLATVVVGSGIAPASAPGFITAQLIGAAVGLALVVWFAPVREPRTAVTKTASDM